MLNFTERGHGPVLVFIHAFPLDSSMWSAQAEFFSERYRVIAPDIIGFGGSQPAREWTISEMGDELLQLLDYLQIERCTLIGLSLGGYISLPFALAHPKRVEHLVLANTRARADLENERAARNAMIEGLRTKGSPHSRIRCCHACSAHLPLRMFEHLFETPFNAHLRRQRLQL